MKGLVAMQRAIEANIFCGSQPTEETTMCGDNSQCPACGGRGKDDGGPGPWTCGTCRGSGQLEQGRAYRLIRYLPYADRRHPNAGTVFEHEGIKEMTLIDDDEAIIK